MLLLRKVFSQDDLVSLLGTLSRESLRHCTKYNQIITYCISLKNVDVNSALNDVLEVSFKKANWSWLSIFRPKKWNVKFVKTKKMTERWRQPALAGVFSTQRETTETTRRPINCILEIIVSIIQSTLFDYYKSNFYRS